MRNLMHRYPLTTAYLVIVVTIVLILQILELKKS